jgi:hypothetical protein
MSDHPPGPPTPRGYAGRSLSVTATCRVCRHGVRLDLAALAAGPHDDTPVIGLPLRCRCGARDHSIRVGYTGRGRATRRHLCNSDPAPHIPEVEDHHDPFEVRLRRALSAEVAHGVSAAVTIANARAAIARSRELLARVDAESDWTRTLPRITPPHRGRRTAR